MQQYSSALARNALAFHYGRHVQRIAWPVVEPGRVSAIVIAPARARARGACPATSHSATTAFIIIIMGSRRPASRLCTGFSLFARGWPALLLTMQVANLHLTVQSVRWTDLISHY